MNRAPDTVRGELTPATLELALQLLLLERTRLEHSIALSKRQLGNDHPSIGQTMRELATVRAAVAEVENYGGLPVAREVAA